MSELEAPPRSLLDHALGFLRRPGATARAVGLTPRVGLGASAIVVYSLAYAGFCVWLAADGREPSIVTLPIAKGQYYRWQALFMLPVLAAGWLVFCGITVAVGRLLGGRGRFAAMLTAFGFVVALPGTIAFVMPDVVVYATGGFGALAKAMRLYAPVTVVWTLALATVSTSAILSLSRARAFAAAFVGFIAYAGAVGLFVR